MKRFFKDFFKRNIKAIVFFSFVRIISLCQVLFWPFAFAKILNILSENINDWDQALYWIIAMGINKVLEDALRLRSKFGLEKIGYKLKIELANFSTEKTEIRNGIKTGQAVQAVKNITDEIENLMIFYKDSFLSLPVNIIAIPIILLSANVQYFYILILFITLYLLVDRLTAKQYFKKLRRFFRAAEIFWGTTYRKAPEIWRHRENEQDFEKELDREGRALNKAKLIASKSNHWRWWWLQSLSSVSKTSAVLYVAYGIAKRFAHVGDLVLVSSYFGKIQVSLNIVTSTANRVNATKIALKRLNKVVKVKNLKPED